ncbi:LysR substrate-binding domain-containing protein [Streptomyces decoyicus]|uniref:LysR substrate-binding domain-containing protein n=1 Tax=Streptomyces decoyicus TaxID=249567 RepID=UPI00382C6F3D
MVRMIDSRLRTLRALRETGTITAAAESLHLTPSTVSQQLRQLSADLDITLLEPVGRKVKLTPAAYTLLDHGDRLFTQWERAMSDLAAHREGLAGHLRISAVASALAALVAPAVTELAQQYPHMTLHVGEDPEEDRFQLLLAREIDVAVTIPATGTPSPDDERFEQHALLEEPQDLLVPQGHPIARKGFAELTELAEARWLRAGDPRDQHQLLLTACAAAGFVPRVTHNAVDWSAVSALVASGLGICLIPRLAPISEGLAVTRVPLRGETRPTRQIVACVRRGSSDQGSIGRGLATLHSTASRWAAEHSG